MKRWSVGLSVGLFLAAFPWAAATHEEAVTPGKGTATPPAAETPAGTGFEGRVVIEGQVLPGARVFAYRTFQDFLDRKAAAASRVTSDDGRWMIDLPRGSYYLVAKKRAAGNEDGPLSAGDHFAFQGSNPIAVVPGKYTHVGFAMVQVDAGVTYEELPGVDSGSLAGVITSGGAPLEGAVVTLYLDPQEDFRGMAYAILPPTGKAGTFRIDSLPEADYFVIARKRANRKASGPIIDGDDYGFFAANPVRVKSRAIARIRIAAVTKAAEIGKDDSLFRETGTYVTGRVLDKDGKVVRGVYVFAYEEKVMAHKRPEHISREVNAEGRYVLNVAEGGVYYLGARSDYGDTPGLGEWYGRYEGTGDHSVRLQTGQVLEGIDIVVEKILP